MDEMTLRAQIAAIDTEQREHEYTAITAQNAVQQCIGARRAFEIMLKQMQKDAAEKAEAEARTADEAKKAEAAKMAEIKPEPEVRAWTEELDALPDTPRAKKVRDVRE